MITRWDPDKCLIVGPGSRKQLWSFSDDGTDVFVPTSARGEIGAQIFRLV